MKKLNVAYIGNFEKVPYSTENDVRKAFINLGHTVKPLQENRDNFLFLEKYNYDLLLITGTWDCSPETLSRYLTLFHGCAKRGIPTATLHLDTFWGTSRDGRVWWLHPMFHTAYIFTADGDYEDKWKLFGKNHIWLPPAVRHDAARPGRFLKKYACDVAFVGSNGDGYHEDVWTYRRELVNALRDMCAKNNWTFRNPGGDDKKVRRGVDMNDFYASAKVTVGDSLCLFKEKSKYWSDRVPEATGRGGFLIMPRVHEINKAWPRLPMYEWGDFEGLERRIDFYLKNGKLRTEIAKDCQQITAHNHTYVNRVRTILKEVGL